MAETPVQTVYTAPRKLSITVFLYEHLVQSKIVVFVNYLGNGLVSPTLQGLIGLDCRGFADLTCNYDCTAQNTMGPPLFTGLMGSQDELLELQETCSTTRLSLPPVLKGGPRPLHQNPRGAGYKCRISELTQAH